MLERLTIRDFVIVDHLALRFETGFGALTGETGAGKSILLDALSLALGGRAEASMVRTGCQRAEVIAEFIVPEDSSLRAWLSEEAIALEEDVLILRRLVETSGRSKGWMNGTPVTQTQLRTAGDALADIHGQHAHHALLRHEAQRALVDAHALALVQAVQEHYQAWSAAEIALQRAQEDAGGLARERDMLAWQLQELEQLGFDPQEWAHLEQEQSRLAHAAGLIEGAAEVVGQLEGDGAVCAQLQTLTQRLGEMAAIDPAVEEAAKLLGDAAIQAQEARHLLRRYADRLDVDPQRLAEVDRRIESITLLARKHRVPPTDLPEVQRMIADRLSALTQAGDPDALAAQVSQCLKQYTQAASALTAHRQKVALEMGEAITAAMQNLAMAGGQFAVHLLPEDAPTAHGQENIEFQVSANPGQPLRALAKVASGGELSRIGLAIQVMTSRDSATPTLIFDEVDVGIGGGVAEIVGKLLRQLGAHRQVLCVTHLPQVAAQAHWQWRILKKTENGQTRSAVTPLEGPERIEEIARMLGGVHLTETTRQHAAEMLSVNDSKTR